MNSLNADTAIAIKSASKEGALPLRTIESLDFISEQIETLVEHLKRGYDGKSLKCIAITSARPAEGKTLSTIAIAYGLANHTNERVLIIDCAQLNPCIDKYFNLAYKKGFTHFFLEGAIPSECIYQTQHKNLFAMPYGCVSKTLSQACRAKYFTERFNLLKSKFEYILLDTTSLKSGSSLNGLGPHLDGATLVIECESTRWPTAKHAVDRLRKNGINVLGSILNKRKYYVPTFLYGRS